MFGSVIAFSACLWLITRVPTAAVATYSLVKPVVAMALGAWILGEPIDSSAMVASALVLIGVALVLIGFALVLWPTKTLPRPEPALKASLALERAR